MPDPHQNLIAAWQHEDSFPCKILQPFEEATPNVCEDVTFFSSVIPCVQALKASSGNLMANEEVQALP